MPRQSPFPRSGSSLSSPLPLGGRHGAEGEGSCLEVGTAQSPDCQMVGTQYPPHFSIGLIPNLKKVNEGTSSSGGRSCILFRTHISYAQNTNRYRWAKAQKGNLPLREELEMLYHNFLFKWEDGIIREQLGGCGRQNNYFQRCLHCACVSVHGQGTLWV